MSSYQTTEHSQFHRTAVNSVSRATLEAFNTAEVINTFRNVVPSVRNYLHEVLVEFKARDETDANISRTVLKIDEHISSIRELNFIKSGHQLVQTPEGFKDKYIPYLTWLDNTGINFINEAEKLLQGYYQSLSMFISSKEAKVSNKDTSRMFIDMEKALGNAKDGLSSFFSAQSNAAIQPIEALFDRAADIPTAVKIVKDLNRKRMSLRTKEILKLTNSISDLLNLLMESSENDKLPEVSGVAISSLAQGALVAAHYVEFVGVLRYRIEEALNAATIAVGQIGQIAKDQK